MISRRCSDTAITNTFLLTWCFDLQGLLFWFCPPLLSLKGKWRPFHMWFYCQESLSIDQNKHNSILSQTHTHRPDAKKKKKKYTYSFKCKHVIIHSWNLSQQMQSLLMFELLLLKTRVLRYLGKLQSLLVFCFIFSKKHYIHDLFK